MLHADPHPGNFRILPGPAGTLGGLGVVDFGAVARLPENHLPEAIGTLLRIAMYDDYDDVLAGLRDEGFVKPNIKVDPDELRAYLARSSSRPAPRRSCSPATGCASSSSGCRTSASRGPRSRCGSTCRRRTC